jgi:glycosidase
MIKLRKKADFEEVFSYGSFKMLYKEDAEIFAYLRVYELTQILVVGNFSSEEKAFKNEYEIKEVLLNNYQDFNKFEETYILKPFQTLVINLKMKDDQL